jgi:L-ascorbate metabolism protein UlaG (beta-lactamase superfamily)
MRITRYTHACVRLDDGDRSLVIDPGTWSEPQALLGVDAVLITHEHHDHVDVLRLAGVGVPIYVPARARLRGTDHARGLDLHLIDTGDRFEAAGFTIQAVGGTHAPVVAGQATCANHGYLIDGAPAGPLYHPGDALHVPDRGTATPVGVLCVPVQGSWLKLSEAIDFTNAVDAPVTIGIHDAQVNDRGLEGITHYLSRHTRTEYRALAPGQSLP